MPTIEGTENDDLSLSGTAVADIIYGYAGNDNLFGLADRDKLFGGDGDDILDGGGGPDYLSGGKGWDMATYSSAAGSVVVSLADPSINAGEATGDTFNSIEYLSGSGFDDQLSGDEGRNLVQGNIGNDTLAGNGGDDSLRGGAGDDVADGGDGADYLLGDDGNDTLTGGEGRDTLYGNGGADILIGGEGDDLFDGNEGKDTLTGGAGQDVFIFGSTSPDGVNVDIITDFNPADDRFSLFPWTFPVETIGGVLNPIAFKDIVDGPKDADDRFIYNSATGNLYYDADGSGAAFGNIKFANIANLAELTAADFVMIH